MTMAGLLVRGMMSSVGRRKYHVRLQRLMPRPNPVQLSRRSGRRRQHHRDSHPHDLCAPLGIDDRDAPERAVRIVDNHLLRVANEWSYRSSATSSKSSFESYVMPISGIHSAVI